MFPPVLINKPDLSERPTEMPLLPTILVLQLRSWGSLHVVRFLKCEGMMILNESLLGMT